MLRGLRPVTVVLAALAVGVTVLDLGSGGGQGWAELNRLGHFSAHQIWDGAWWAYLTTVFLHAGALHLAFNLYWLWLFGSVLEDRLGSLRFLELCALCAFVGSGSQLALSDTTGVGLSGVGYGLFAYSWARSRTDPSYELRREVVRLFVVWFFVAIAIDLLGLVRIANWAHLGGAAAGAGLGVVQGGRGLGRRALGAAGLLVAVAFAAAPLVGQPWSTEWLRHEAVRLQEEGRHARALALYDRILARSPDDAWAAYNRGVAHQNLGQYDEAVRDYERACALDPQYCR